MRRRVRAAVGALIGMAALTVGIPMPSLAVGRACAAGEIHVAVVIDFGDVASTTSTCVAAGTRDNGAFVLATRASQLGRAAPRFGSSGLLCAIDNIPASGCGESHGGKYAYWSYWHGTDGQWSYSNVGPGGSRVNADVVEGWRWEPNGAGNPTDPAPRGSPSPSATCASAPPPPPPPAPPPVIIAPGGGTGTVPPGGTAAGPDPTAVPHGVIATPGIPPRAGTTRPTTSSTTARGASTTDPATASTVKGSDLAATSAQHDSSSGPPVGLLVGGLLIGGLAIAGIVVARRRSKPAS